MSGIRDLGAARAFASFTQTRNLQDLLRSRSRTEESRETRSVYHLGSTQARIDARREIAEGEARLLRAADALRESTPRARLATESTRERTGTERVGRTTTSEVTSTVTTPATVAEQYSIGFTSPDAIVSRKGDRLEFRNQGTNIRIDIGNGGATLQEIADLINTDSDNNGVLTASVVDEGANGFRLHVQTVATGSSARLSIRRDDFSAPAGGTPTSPPIFGNYNLIDSSRGVDRGSDAVTNTVTTTQTNTTYEDVAKYERVERTTLVEDEDFEAVAQEFVDAFNDLNQRLARHSAPAEEGYAKRLLADDSHVLGLTGALSQVAEGLAERKTSTAVDLAQFGFEVDAEGALQIDSDVLQRALAEDPSSAEALLTSRQGGLAHDLTQELLRNSRSNLEGGISFLVDRSDSASSGLQAQMRLIGDLFRIQLESRDERSR